MISAVTVIIPAIFDASFPVCAVNKRLSGQDTSPTSIWSIHENCPSLNSRMWWELLVYTSLLTSVKFLRSSHFFKILSAVYLRGATCAHLDRLILVIHILAWKAAHKWYSLLALLMYSCMCQLMYSPLNLSVSWSYKFIFKIDIILIYMFQFYFTR